MTFEEIRASCPVYTAVDDNRSRLIYDLVRETNPLGGFMAEVGVYKGGTSWLIANTDASRQLHSIDTFEGLPVPSPIDAHKYGDFNDTSYEKVTDLLRFHNVSVCQGLFPKAFPDQLFDDEFFSFVHIDVDLYDSILDCLNWFYPRMISGGYIVVDDYGMTTCPGVKPAVDTFMFGKREELKVNGFNSCYIKKL